VGRMRQLADNPKGALEAVHQAQAVNPKAVSPMFLTLELIRPDLPEAESLVRQYLSRPQSEPEVRMAYARTLLEAQRLSEALIQFELLTTQQPDYAPGWLAVGMFQLQTGQLNAAQTGFQHYLDLTATTDNEAAQRGKTEAQLGLSEIAERRGNLVEAGRWLDQIGTPTPRLGLVARRASLLARQGHLDQARTLIQAWPAQTPEDARAKLMTETQLLRDNQQFPAAFDLLAQALVQTPDDTDLLYEQSLIADKLGQFEVMEQLLRQIIALKPDHFNAYNALGYSLAERNLRLDEARQLIQKALSFTPNDPLIQDSLGWVEFRSGHHDEALRILRAAFKARPDADVAAHLGEVLWQMGQRDEALAIWKQGRQLNPDNETITETLKRLRVSL